ncbi:MULTISPECIES: SseB family protein [unclassified Micromonospora]|uniref:SseB family protein n=1 Tax=unclassified Micromonospora TaxID=2617518 RepID=UPI0022B64B73|nr:MULTISPECIES: SseB family protein [unclassified Micromonospora]MCZ7421390.1 SseB family protein [Verrucosispora sp. WMMA2121]WBB93922.1 SseB family protein [Verrucosispora sp. WMMC514]
MTDWEPATGAEAAMRDALHGNDQQLYFRILSGVELLLPVSAQAAAGRTPVGWGTWTTGGRTHVLAFTSAEAMRACLGEHAGPSRRTGYAELAASWPNHEWWLAVNPGLPIEGYLPAWYVSQLSRGDVRLPGRTVGARARLERVEALNRARDAASASSAPATPNPPAPATPNPPAPPRSPGPVRPTQLSPAPPVVPAAFHLPEVPPATSSTVARPRPDLADRSPGTAARPAPADSSGMGRADAQRPGGLGAARPDGPGTVGGASPRRPAPGRTEEPTSGGPGWPTAPDRSGTSTNGDPAGSQPTGQRSFFEPANGRSPHRGDRLVDRAAPPSRFRGGQPFPRRGPAGEQPSDGPTRAFVFSEDDQATTRTRPVPHEETTQPLPPPDGPVRPLRVSTPAGWAAPGGGDPTAGGGDPTEALPRRQPEEEQPTSAAEPVSAPPAPRRGFTPIVIEGTIIEARDLTLSNGHAGQPGGPTGGGDRSATGVGAASVRPAAEDAKVAGRPDPTVADPEPTAVDPQRVAVDPEPTVRFPAPRPEPTVAAAEPTEAVPAAPPEPTVPVQTVTPESTVAAPTAAPAPPRQDQTDAGVAVAAPAARPPGPAVQSPSLFTPVSGTPSAASESSAPTPTSGAPIAPTSGGPTAPTSGAPTAPAGPPFQPANEVEEDLYGAAEAGSTDTFLSTLLLARVLLPVAADSAPGSRPGDPGFVWPAVQLDGQTFVVAYTSPQRLADHTDPAAETVQVRFVQLIRKWPDLSWSFAVNPGTPVGAKLPGEQIVGLANWAAELGLGDDAEGEPEPNVEAPAPASSPRQAAPAGDLTRPIVMQKAIAPSQLGYYLERGYDRVSGFVHRASELAHLTTPAALYQALGLNHPESPFAPDAEQIYVLRWPAYRPSLYRIPYGGQNEAAMRAMEGWVIERPPFRGNGFAPGEGSDVLAEFKVDSVRLPHGAQLVRIDAAGTERPVAVLDADTLSWREVGER